jgi:hypothetical protein
MRAFDVPQSAEWIFGFTVRPLYDSRSNILIMLLYSLTDIGRTAQQFACGT